MAAGVGNLVAVRAVRQDRVLRTRVVIVVVDAQVVRLGKAQPVPAALQGDLPHVPCQPHHIDPGRLIGDLRVERLRLPRQFLVLAEQEILLRRMWRHHLAQVARNRDQVGDLARKRVQRHHVRAGVVHHAVEEPVALDYAPVAGRDLPTPGRRRHRAQVGAVRVHEPAHLLPRAPGEKADDRAVGVPRRNVIVVVHVDRRVAGHPPDRTAGGRVAEHGALGKVRRPALDHVEPPPSPTGGHLSQAVEGLRFLHGALPP